MHRPRAACLAAVIASWAAVSALPGPVAAQPAESLPARRPGQWEMQMVTEKPAGGPKITTQTCIDAATDREIMEFALRMSKDNCKRYELKRAGAGWVIDADCSFGPLKSVTRTTVSGDFKSTVSMRIEGTTEGLPGSKGPQATLMTQTARFVGACSQGMKPGDIAMSNGMKLNIKQMKGLKKLLGQIQIR